MGWTEGKLKECISNASISTTLNSRLFAKRKSVWASGAAVRKETAKTEVLRGLKNGLGHMCSFYRCAPFCYDLSVTLLNILNGHQDKICFHVRSM